MLRGYVPRRTACALALMVLATMAVGSPVRAQDAPGVTLRANETTIEVGQQLRLTGKVEPASEGETVTIADEEGRERAEATTDATGRFVVTIRPRYTTTLYARWLAAISEPIEIEVRPKVGVNLRKVRLFGRATVLGTVRPLQEEGGTARVTLFRNGSAVWTRHIDLADGRRFSTRFKVRRPGNYRVAARYTDPHDATGRGKSARLSPPLPYLSSGSRNVYVKLLKGRLRELKYHVDGVNRRYTTRTADAVIAFNKIQRRARRGIVDADTWRALASAKRPRARFTKGTHVEIDQTRQVVMMVRDGKVTRVIHTSTGRNGYTRNGTFRVHRKLEGYSPNRLYYPAYFDGLRAFHGWPEVPTYNASSGCARLPMWTAKWIFNRVEVGTVVRVYH